MDTIIPSRVLHRATRLLALCLAAACVHVCVAAPGLEAFAGTIAGYNTCGGGGPPPPLAFFGSLFSVGSGGNGISDCGLSGGYTDLLGTTAPLAASRQLPAVQMPEGGVFNGQAAGNAAYSTLAASAQGSLTGPDTSPQFGEAAGFGVFETNLLFAGSPSHPAGSPGTAVYSFLVAGTITASGLSTYDDQGLASLVVQENGFYQGDVFSAGAFNKVIGSVFGTGAAGFTTGPGTVAGSGTFSTIAFGFVYGRPVDLKVGLISVADPAAFGMASTDFTASLSGITVDGEPVNPVPEPETSALMLGGLLALVAVVWRRGAKDDACGHWRRS